jgi:hypothetical protein
MPDELIGCQVTRGKFERVEVVGPMAMLKGAKDYFYARGYDLKSSGAYTDAKMFPKCDVTRFRLVVERDCA